MIWVGPAARSLPALAAGAPDVVGRNIDVTRADGTQNETSVAVDPTDPRHMLAASNDSADAAGSKAYESFDGGRTWAISFTPPPRGCYDPWVDFNAQGDAFFAFECLDQRIATKKAGETTWSSTILENASFAPDRDMVVVDTTPTSPFIGSVYVGYDEGVDTNGGHLLYSRTGFGDWVRSPRINDRSRTIGVNAAVAPDGTVFATWLDFDRKRLMVDSSSDGGATWGSDHPITMLRLNTRNFWVFIPPQPDRGIIAMPFGTVAPAGSPNAGRLYVTYTDLSVGSEDTDVFVRYSDDGGATWSAETKVNDDSVGAYQFHPRIAVGADGTLAVAFYDTRNDPTDVKTDTYISYSTDGGQTWSANQKVTTAQSDQSGGGDDFDYGDYQGIDASGSGGFQVVWGDSRPGWKNEEMATASARP
jgi:hypothetical protein